MILNYKTIQTIELNQFYLDIMKTETDLDFLYYTIQDICIRHKQIRADINTQLEEAMAMKNTKGVKSDADWFVRARTKKRHEGIAANKIQEMLGIISKVQKKRNIPVEKIFIDSARLLLDSETFNLILDKSFVVYQEQNKTEEVKNNVV